jgi:hypothetical protein
MQASVRSVEYYYAVVPDRPGVAAELLTLLAKGGVDLLAFSILPTGPTHTQLMIFPEEPNQLVQTCKRASIELVGPQNALMVTGDDELGAMVEIHEILADATINVYAASGVSDGRDGFGYIIYVRPEDFKHAATVLGIAGAPSWRPSGPLIGRTPST